MREVPCPACGGARLKPVSLGGDRSTAATSTTSCDLSIGEAAEVLASLELSERDRMIAERVVKEVNARMSFLLDVGLDYLSLDRVGGHARRRRGAAHPPGAARSAAGWSACCTCSTSRRSACTSATTAG